MSSHIRSVSRNIDLSIQGQGGGKAGGGGQAPHEDANDLRSKAIAKFIELLGEGENGGLVNGAKSIYLDGTPLQNADDSYNFEGVVWEERKGTVDQSPIPGFTESESEVAVSTQVRYDTGPVVREISNDLIHALRVRIQLPSLYKVVNEGSNQGDILRHTVSFRIEYKSLADGVWLNPYESNLTIEGKTLSAYEADYRFTLTGTAPWQVRVTRVTADEDEAHLFSETFFAGYTEIIEEQYTYPYCHIIGVKVDTALFGTSIPDRAYHVRGRIVEVPVNYDPIARTHTGIWNGTFKLAWTDNPAWCYRDMLVHDRYGLGKRIKNYHVDDATLYVISQYCDEDVPDGFGGFEPRFTLNLGIMEQEEAYKVINDMASVFWGMTYWAAGNVTVTQDRPRSPEMLVTNANVEEGRFRRSGTSLTSRANAVIVAYNDPDDLFRQKTEIVQDNWAVIHHGYRPKFVTAFGCASRGQAHRLARWLLLTEQRQNETITYRAADDHQWVMPGTVIEVMDTSEVSGRWGGRIVSLSTDRTEITVDEGPTDPGTGLPNQFCYLDADGTLQRVAITDITGNVITVSSPLDAGTTPGAIWMANDSGGSRSEYFQVISNKEVDDEPGVREITALTYIHEKFEDIETGSNLTTLNPNIQPVGALPGPTSLEAAFSLLQNVGAAPMGVAHLSWTPARDTRVTHYEFEVSRNDPGQFEVGGQTQRPGLTYAPLGVGDDFQFRVRSVAGATGQRSIWVTSDTFTNVGDTTPPDVPTNWTGQAGFDMITLTGDPSEATDFREFRIYGATASSGALDLLASTPATTYTRRPPSGDTYTRYKISAVDYNGNESAKTAFIDVVPITSAAVSTPTTPTSLSVTSSLGVGDGMATLVVTWTGDNTNGTIFELEITIAGRPAVRITTANTRYEGAVLPGQAVTVRVRARNVYGQFSAWTSTASHTTATDSTPPAVPTGFAAEATFNGLWLRWTPNTEADFLHYEIRRKTTDAAPANGSTTVDYTLMGTALFVPETAGEARYYWIRSVDTSGNKSNWSTSITSTALEIGEAIDTEMLAGLIDATSFAAGLSPVGVVNTLPATNVDYDLVLLTTDGKLYRWTGGVWVRAVAATDITGQITTTQITDGAITTGKILSDQIVTGHIQTGAIKAAQIDVGAVTASKVAIGSFDNLNIDLDFDDASLWTGTHTLVATTAFTTWGGKRYLSIVGAGGDFVPAYGPSFKIDPAGEELWIRARMRSQSGLGVVAINIQISTDETFGTVTNIFGGLNTSSNTIETFDGDFEIPAGYAFARLRFYKNSDGATEGRFGGVEIRRKNGGQLIVDGSIYARHIEVDDLVVNGLAHITTAYIVDANISGTLNANKITSINSTVTVNGSGTTIANIDTWASDPAAKINSGSTQIGAGKITLWGGNLGQLVDWRAGGDWTKIDGGFLSANSVAANVLTIGSRNIVLNSINFTTDKDNNKVSWTGGNIRYMNDTGGNSTRSIDASTVTYPSGVTYAGTRIWLYWVKDGNSILATTDQNTAFGSNNYVLGNYNGGSDLTTTIGRTIIDGDHIKTGTIEAIHVKVGSLDADRITAGTITADRLAFGVGSGNLLANTDFSQGLLGMNHSGSGASHADNTMSLRTGTTYTGANYPTIQLEQATSESAGYSQINFHRPLSDGSDTRQNISVTPGEIIQFSAHASSFQASGSLFLTFFDVADVSLGNSTAVTITNNTPGSSTNPDAWPVYWGNALVPASAATARLVARKNGTSSGSSSRLGVHKPQMIRVPSVNTGRVPYSPGVSTIINGSSIVTGSLTAEAVDATSFGGAGLSIFGGSIISDYFNGEINELGVITDPGDTGWALTKAGNLALNALITRRELQEGSVSDGGSFWQSAGAKYTDNAVACTVALSDTATYEPPTADALFQISFSVESRSYGSHTYDTGTTDKEGAPVYDTYIGTTIAYLQERRIVGGVPQAWETILNTTPNSSNTWVQTQLVSQKVFYDVDDVEWRITMSVADAAGLEGAGADQNNLRRVGLSIRAVRR